MQHMVQLIQTLWYSAKKTGWGALFLFCIDVDLLYNICLEDLIKEFAIKKTWKNFFM